MLEKSAVAILSIGDSMHDQGVNNWALTQIQANAAIGKFLEIEIPILGGDVYLLRGTTYKGTNDHWALDPFPGELRKEYLVRTIEYAKQKVDLYSKFHGQNVRFVLVPGRQGKEDQGVTD